MTRYPLVQDAAYGTLLREPRRLDLSICRSIIENHGGRLSAGEFTGKGVVAAREVKPTGAGAPGTKPSSIGTLDTKPIGAGTPGTKPSGVGTLDTKPGSAGEPSTKPTGGRALEKKEPAGGNPPKPPNTEVKPVVTGPPQQTVKPNPPPRPVPATTAAVKPPSPAPAKPAVRPACPPGKRMTPAGCK
jgi:hypothetical protein